MRSGILNRIATLQNLATGGDAYNSSGTSYATATAGLFVGVNPVSGKELRGEKQDGSEITAEITTWYRADITAGSRIVVDGVTWEVLYIIDPKFKHVEMRLQCKAVS